MSETLKTLDAVLAAIYAAPRRQKRRLIAVCGAPASGKSTLAAALSEGLNGKGCATCVVPMDGFHLDNAILKAKGTFERKGAPHTFDSAGFAALIRRCGHEDEVYYPTFDRARDIGIAASGVVSAGIDTVLVEGNYLLMQTSGWRDLAALWDMSIYLDVPENELQKRLVARWLDHGMSLADATARAAQNDLPNARVVIDDSAAADYVFTPQTSQTTLNP